MPQSQTEKVDLRDRVQVTVRGATLGMLREAAEHAAAEFFGVERSTHRLEPGAIAAEPHLTAVDGQVINYKATLWVYLQPPPATDEDDSGSAPVGPPPFTGTINIPARRQRPAAPRLTDEDDDEAELHVYVDDEPDEDADD